MLRRVVCRERAEGSQQKDNSEMILIIHPHLTFEFSEYPYDDLPFSKSIRLKRFLLLATKNPVASGGGGGETPKSSLNHKDVYLFIYQAGWRKLNLGWFDVIKGVDIYYIFVLPSLVCRQ